MLVGDMELGRISGHQKRALKGMRTMKVTWISGIETQNIVGLKSLRRDEMVTLEPT